ncbi:hypothetical protein FKP32DRAFT_75215 [Trametes sanguinea]|nr:hypothetical protein FKP32DRAFT_75215 [Trametes sanguinea]
MRDTGGSTAPGGLKLRVLRDSAILSVPGGCQVVFLSCRISQLGMHICVMIPDYNASDRRVHAAKFPRACQGCTGGRRRTRTRTSEHCKLQHRFTQRHSDRVVADCSGLAALISIAVKQGQTMSHVFGELCGYDGSMGSSLRQDHGYLSISYSSTGPHMRRGHYALTSSKSERLTVGPLLEMALREIRFPTEAESHVHQSGRVYKVLCSLEHADERKLKNRLYCTSTWSALPDEREKEGTSA